MNQITQSMRTLDFDDKASTIDVSIDTLRRTAGYELATGKMPKSRPVDHHVFMTEVIGMFNTENAIDVSAEPIHISKRHTARVGWDSKKNGEIVPLDKYLVKRAITRIHSNVKGNASTMLNPSVSICYNELGIEVAFGVNNKVCSNMTIMGSDKIYKTYGSDKMDFYDMKDRVRRYIDNMGEWYQNDYKTIEKLSNTEIDEKKINEMIGELLESAVYGMNNHNDSILNCSQVNNLVRQRLKNRLKSHTAWEFVNWGTDFLKAQGNDFVTLNTANNKFNNYVLDTLNISN